MKNNKQSGLDLLLILGLFFSSFSAFAGKSETLKCIDLPNPPDCLVHVAANSSSRGLDDLYKYVMLAGSTDLVPTKALRLSKEAREVLQLETGLTAYFDAPTSKSMAKVSDETILAAIALASAAQHLSDPYTDAVVQAFLRKTNEKNSVSLLAAQLWFKTFPFKYHPLGFPKILSTVATLPDLKKEILLDIACDAAYFNQDKEQALAIIRQAISGSDASADMKAHAASELVRSFALDAEALELLKAGGKQAEHFDTNAILVDVAKARLRHGYDARAAKLLSEYAFVARYGTDEYRNDDRSKERQILQSAKATTELKYMGNEFMRYAGDKSRSPYQRGNMYAIASDCYLRAGERQLALETAREGLAFVPNNATEATHNAADTSKKTKVELARSALGPGTEPVVALYRAGAVDEALASGYLTGRDRYENAQIAGEKPNPEWVLDYDERLATMSMVANAVASHNLDTQQQVYNAILAWCDARSWCSKGNDETNEHLATLAAAIGDRKAMEQQLAIATKAIDGSPGLAAAKLAEQWLRDLQLLNDVALVQEGQASKHTE